MSDPGPPTSYLALADGTRVVSSDGEELGTVRHVLAVPDDDVFDGLVIDTPHGPRFADAPIVGDLYEREARLTVSAREAADLPAPSENPAALDADPAEDGAGNELTDKLRRAWDLLTGNY